MMGFSTYCDMVRRRWLDWSILDTVDILLTLDIYIDSWYSDGVTSRVALLCQRGTAARWSGGGDMQQQTRDPSGSPDCSLVVRWWWHGAADQAAAHTMATVDMICSVHRWRTTGHSVDQKMFEWKVVAYISNITSLYCGYVLCMTDGEYWWCWWRVTLSQLVTTCKN